MSTVILSDEWRTAIKPHRCGACTGTIGTGDTYRHQANVSDGFGVWKAHRLCDAIYDHVLTTEEIIPELGETVEPSEIHAFLWPMFGTLARMMS